MPARDSWPYRRVLVTGGGGYLATALLSRLQDLPSRIRRLCRRPAPGPQRADAFEEVFGDVRDPALWRPLLDGVDLVFHLAAQTSAKIANEDPPADWDLNVAPMLRLLEACRGSGSSPVVLFAGTATQVGITRTVPVNERAVDRPATVYDLHKLMAEHYLEYYVRMGVVRGAALRLSNVYGPGPRSSSADRGVLNVMIRKAVQGEPLTVFGPGRHVRDYVYVGDVAEAFLLAAQRIDQVSGRHFVVGSGQAHTVAEAIALVAERAGLRTGRRLPVVHADPPVPPAPIEERDFVADSTQFRSATGWRAIVTLKAGIDRTIEALRADGAGPP